MRAVVQRVKSAYVEVEGKVSGSIDSGILVLIGIRPEDTERDLEYIYNKVTKVRIFDDANGVMNESLLDQGKELLVVSQFTLYGDGRKGNRPSYIAAAKGDVAEPIYEEFIAKARENNIPTATGVFGADMEIHAVCDGPVTILFDSDKLF